jgi:hypothetical protein
LQYIIDISIALLVASHCLDTLGRVRTVARVERIRAALLDFDGADHTETRLSACEKKIIKNNFTRKNESTAHTD